MAERIAGRIMRHIKAIDRSKKSQHSIDTTIQPVLYNREGRAVVDRAEGMLEAAGQRNRCIVITDRIDEVS